MRLNIIFLYFYLFIFYTFVHVFLILQVVKHRGLLLIKLYWTFFIIIINRSQFVSV